MLLLLLLIIYLYIYLLFIAEYPRYRHNRLIYQSLRELMN